MEDLRDVILIGHSYGGMVATGVADREATAIARLVYLDAFVPRDGESALGSAPAGNAGTYRSGGARRRRLAPAAESPAARHSGRGPGMDDAAPDAAAGETGEQPIRLTGAVRAPAAHLHLLHCGRAQATCSGSSRSAREPNPAGSIWRSTRATTRTSPRPTLATLLHDIAGRVPAGQVQGHSHDFV